MSVTLRAAGRRRSRGIRVLDLSRLLPGPFLTMVLADMGADVVKVEDPRVGDYLRAFPPAKGGIGGRFLAVNRGKRSLALDLKAPAGRDALLQDGRAGRRRRRELPARRDGQARRRLRRARARATRRSSLCSISGYGQTGPYVERAGHDLNYIALAGVLAMTGTCRRRAADARRADRRPRRRCAVGRDRDPRRARRPRAHRQGRAPRHLDDRGRARAARRRARQPRLRRATRRAAPRRSTAASPCYGVYRTTRTIATSRSARSSRSSGSRSNQAIGRPPNVAELVGNPGEQADARASSPRSSRRRPPPSGCEHPRQARLLRRDRHRARRAAATIRCTARASVFFEIDGGDGVGPCSQIRTPVGTPGASDRRRRASASTRATSSPSTASATPRSPVSSGDEMPCRPRSAAWSVHRDRRHRVALALTPHVLLRARDAQRRPVVGAAEPRVGGLGRARLRIAERGERGGLRAQQIRIARRRARGPSSRRRARSR